MSDYDLINGEILTVTVTVDEETVIANINTAARGPAGTSGSGAITGATTSDGTADLSLANVTTATATITGMSVAPTASTTTSTTQLATTAFVQQELASGVAVAKNLEFLAHNGSGATIAKGSIVYINGAVGGIPRVVKAQANNDTNSARTIGFAKADIANGANGFVISEGELENVRTADADGIIGAGNQIFLSPTTPGAFTQTKPSAPQHLVYVGVVVTASTGVALDGKILVGIQNGYELDELHDVAISSPAAKQVIKRNAGNTLWVNDAIVSADVSDATSAATANRIVIRDGSGAASLSGLTNSGNLNLATGTTFTYGTGIASAHRIALGAGTTGAELFGAADAAAARNAIRTKVVQAADLSVLSSSAVVGTDLVITLIGGVDYLIRGVFDMVSGTQAAGQKMEMYTTQDVSEPFGTASGVTLGTRVAFASVDMVALASLRRANFWTYTGAVLTRRVQFEICIKLVSTGDIQFFFAQAAPGATASVFKAGSFLTAEIL